VELNKTDTFVSAQDQIWLAKGCTKSYPNTFVTIMKYFPCQSWW